MEYLFYGLLLACAVNLACCIDCHQCQTMERKSCNDPYPLTDFNMENVDGCDDDHYCVKYKTIVKIRDSGYIDGSERHSKVVTRTCEPKQGKKEGCIGWQNNGGVTIKCWCGTDGCNTARSLAPSSLSLLVSLSVATVAVFRCLHSLVS